MLNFLLQFSLFLISPRWGLDRKGRLAIESYIRGNNLALDVSSVLDGYADKITFNQTDFSWWKKSLLKHK